MSGYFYLVSTPIGNFKDITLRALEILTSVNFIICEEYKEAKRLLSYYKIDKELVALNEHNEKESSEEILPRLLNGESAALISDCGTPLFSDPGHYLLGLCLGKNIKVIPVPGVNSLLPAITASGLHVEKFYYYGWLSPKKEERRKQLFKLKTINEVIVILDTPYRLKTLLSDVQQIFGSNLKIVLAFEITKDKEKFYRGPIAEIIYLVEKQSLKGEFVLSLDNRNSSHNY